MGKCCGQALLFYEEATRCQGSRVHLWIRMLGQGYDSLCSPSMLLNTLQVDTLDVVLASDNATAILPQIRSMKNYMYALLVEHLIPRR